jgi:hypothetical protein
MKTTPKIQIDVGFASFELYDTYLIATVSEGVVLGKKEMQTFHKIFLKYYGNRPFGYISNRINDYTVNPLYYKEVEKHDLNIVAISTLCFSEESYKMAVFAEQFFNWPHKAFYTLEECIAFIDTHYKNYKKAGL